MLLIWEKSGPALSFVFNLTLAMIFVESLQWIKTGPNITKASYSASAQCCKKILHHNQRLSMFPNKNTTYNHFIPLSKI
jgi:hypothetical protein